MELVWPAAIKVGVGVSEGAGVNSRARGRVRGRATRMGLPEAKGRGRATRMVLAGAEGRATRVVLEEERAAPKGAGAMVDFKLYHREAVTGVVAGVAVLPGYVFG